MLGELGVTGVRHVKALADAPTSRRRTMRFLLVARARTSGRIRLLSERAYDSRTAAVDAAAETAASIDFGDDEVLAIDLDSAGPVLVLRVDSRRQSGAQAEPEAAGEPEAPVAPVPPVPPAPIVRLQPRFPIFGIDEDAAPADDTLAATLRSVARRMEADFSTAWTEESVRFDEDWDARTLDEYALPDDLVLDDGALSAAREEGRTRLDGVVSEIAPESDALDLSVPIDLPDAFEASDAAVDVEDVAVVDLPDVADVLPDHDGTVPEATADGSYGLSGAVPSPVDRSTADVSTDDPPATEPAVDMAAPDAHDDSRSVAWEPPTAHYRPANIDFAVWVCADCVYQRTCSKAGVASPASCGTFQWRSR